MPRLKQVEVLMFRGNRVLRLWQYTARGGKSLVYQVRLDPGETAAEALKRGDVVVMLSDVFGLKGV